jgi:hypothetical protein
MLIPAVHLSTAGDGGFVGPTWVGGKVMAIMRVNWRGDVTDRFRMTFEEARQLRELMADVETKALDQLNQLAQQEDTDDDD